MRSGESRVVDRGDPNGAEPAEVGDIAGVEPAPQRGPDESDHRRAAHEEDEYGQGEQRPAEAYPVRDRQCDTEDDEHRQREKLGDCFLDVLLLLFLTPPGGEVEDQARQEDGDQCVRAEQRGSPKGEQREGNGVPEERRVLDRLATLSKSEHFGCGETGDHADQRPRHQPDQH